MFYYENWDQFCSRLTKTAVECVRACDVSVRHLNHQFVVLKHDVESKPSKALKLAQIEHKHGIRGSYYVQAYLLDEAKDLKVLKEIASLGHELSYHYDVLDASSGDLEKANIDFQSKLEKFKQSGFELTTVCQHGNPVKNRVGYSSNRDFFRNENIALQYNYMTDIVVNFKEKKLVSYLYVSDAGYKWNIISDPENNDRVKGLPDIVLKSFDDILSEVKKGNSLIVSTHPHRWEKHRIIIFLNIWLFKLVRIVFKTLSQNKLIKSVLNRFYYLAKKI